MSFLSVVRLTKWTRFRWISNCPFSCNIYANYAFAFINQLTCTVNRIRISLCSWIFLYFCHNFAQISAPRSSFDRKLWSETSWNAEIIFPMLKSSRPPPWLVKYCEENQIRKSHFYIWANDRRDVILLYSNYPFS